MGLAAVTPAAGFIDPIAGIPIGIVAAILSFYAMLLRARGRRIDESLDVWACHGVGGIWGTLAVGIFATAAVNSAGADGLLLGNAAQFVKQLIGVVVVGGYAFGTTWVLGKVVDIVVGLRVRGDEEMVGLDISQHGERAFGGIGS